MFQNWSHALCHDVHISLLFRKTKDSLSPLATLLELKFVYPPITFLFLKAQQDIHQAVELEAVCLHIKSAANTTIKQHTFLCAGVGAGFQPAGIATGKFSSFITSTTGQVVVCGVNNYGQLGLPVEVCTRNSPFFSMTLLAI